MPGWKGHASPNPMQRYDCWSCGQADVGGAQCGNCGRRSRDPFVVVFDVGQGNLNAIVDAEGKVLAYFDFGYSTAGGSQPAPPTRPCFCDNPLIILSHWDQDHINMSKYVDQCLTAEWLVPEQGHSDFATKLQKRIKSAGGRITTVPYVANDRHITFPWGFIERCSGPADDPNGSGLAAFVCVRHSPSHPAPVLAAASVETVTSSAISPVAQRAAAAHNMVAARIGALGVANVNGATFAVASPLATVFAASQTIAGRQARMPVQECVDAAVYAAERAVVHGDNAVTIRNTLHAANRLPTLRGHNINWARDALAELGLAAVDVLAQRTYSARVRAAAARLTHDGSISPEAWNWLGVRAASPLPPAGPATLRTGAAPRHFDERYILLNGDAEFRYVRAMQRHPRPRVVGLTAMHHGAIYEGQMALHGASIPFAPGSHAAKAVVAFRRDRAAAGSLVSVVTEAGLALQRKRKRRSRRPLRVAASRTARAAASAIHSLQAAHPGELAAAPQKFAAVAAAAAVAAWRYPDSVVVGLAAMLASTTQNVSRQTDTSPIETVVELAHAAVHAHRNAGALSVDEVKNISAGGIDGDLVGHVDNIAAAGVGGGNVGLAADDAGQEAASALGELWSSYRLGLKTSAAKNFKARIALDNADENVLNDLATAATAAILASRHGQANRHTMATSSTAAATSVGAAGLAGGVAASTTATVRTDYWTAPLNLVDNAAWVAARLAAECAVAYLVGTTCEAVRSVIASAHDGPLRRDAYNALGRRSRRDGLGGRIAYSYGVDAGDRAHGYSKQTVSAGYCGHAHSLAVRKYEARGWTRRLNASARSRHRGAQGDPDRGHPYGHLWLAWDSVDDAPYPPEPVSFRCRRCGKSYKLRG